MAESGRILIVDDDAVSRRFLCGLLRNAGYEPHEAEDGEAGLQKAAAIRPALILLDLVLPGRDGFEVLQELKRDPAARSVPVVILSVRDREEDVVRGFDLGAEDYVVKPFGAREIVARIRRILRRAG